MAKQWYVAHTQVNQEQRAARGLGEQLIKTYLPLARVEVRLTSGLLVSRNKPVFSRYLFFNLDPKKDGRWHSVLGTKGIRAIIGYQSGMDSPSSVPKQVMQELKSRLAMAADIFPLDASRPTFISPGTMVTVLFGPFRDQSASVQVDHGSRVEVLLRFAGALRHTKLPKDCLAVAA